MVPTSIRRSAIRAAAQPLIGILESTMTTNTKTTRVALYCRVSTTEQGENGKSLLDQEQTLKQWAKLQEWQVVEVYVDQCSGGTDERPRLQDMLMDAKAKRFDLILTTKLDRFMRNTRLTLNSIEELKKSDVALVTMDGTDTRQGGIAEVMYTILASMAQYERIRIGERIKAGRAYRKALNQWSGGRPPFGYRFIKETKQLVIEDKEAESIRYAFNEYTKSNGPGLAKLAAEMNKAGYTPPRLNRKHQKSDYWTSTTTLHILTHNYTGEITEQWPYKAPMIVTPEVWQAAQLQRKTNRQYKPGERQRIDRTLYQGRLKCGLCGHTLQIAYNGGHHKVYACPGRRTMNHTDGSPHCTLPRFNAANLDKKITAKIEKLCSDPQLLINYFEQYEINLKNEQAELEKRLKPMRQEADSIKEDIAIATTRLEARTLSRADYLKRVNELQTRLDNIESRTSDLDSTLVSNIDAHNQVIEFCKFAVESLRAVIDGNMTTKDAQEILVYQPEPTYKPTAQDVVRTFYNTVKNPGDLAIDGKEFSLANLTGDAFKYFTIYPNKIELSGSIAMRKSNIAPALEKTCEPLFFIGQRFNTR